MTPSEMEQINKILAHHQQAPATRAEVLNASKWLHSAPRGIATRIVKLRRTQPTT